MKSMKKILAEFREYTQKVNSLEKVIEARKAKQKQLGEDREILDEISSQSAEKIYDWMRDTDGMPYDFEELFDGAMRVYFPLASDDQMKLAKVVKELKSANWGVPEIDIGYGPHKAFETKKVKQKLQRLAADGGGEYEIEVDVADLRLVRKTQKVIPAGPRAGETVEKKEETTMSKAIARLVKGGQLDKGMYEWWQAKQVLYTRDGQHKQIEKAFSGEDGSSYSVVVSRHPIDVLRMSDISNIRSCHSEGSEYFHCAIAEAKGHGPIAYLVKTEDLENHLMDKADDRNPVQQLGHDLTYLDRDEYREKITTEYDLDSVQGRMLYLETWAHTTEGARWLAMFERDVKMASKPDQFRTQKYQAMTIRLGIFDGGEALRAYHKWWKSDRAPGGVAIHLGMNQPPPGVSEKDWKEAYDAVYNKPEEKDTGLKPLSNFDDQELFRDRDRRIQGIGAAARVRLRKFEEPMRFGTFAVPEVRVYGANVPGFVDSVKEWAVEGQRDQFVGDDGDLAFPRRADLTRRGGSYGDNRDGDILNRFFRKMASADDDDSWREPYDPHQDVYKDDDDEENEMEQRWEEYERETEELNEHANNTLKHCYASGHVDGDEEPYVHADGGVEYEIDLGWKNYVEEDGKYYPADANENIIDGFEIPKSWGGDWAIRNAFDGALTDPVDYYPEETDWEIDSGGDGVTLRVRHRISCDECTNPQEFEYFIDMMESDIDANYRENLEKIRRSLVEAEYLAPNDWDNLEDDFSEMEESLKNWSVIGVGDEDGEVIFSLNPVDSLPGSNKLFTGIKWPYPSGSHMSNLTTLQGLFGGTTATFGIERYVSLSPNANERGGYSSGQQGRGGMLFAKRFRGLQQAANEYAKRQLDLDFGPEYERKADPLVGLAKNIELGITLGTNAASYTESDETLELAFHMRVKVFSDHTSDEIEAAFNFVKYIDANMSLLKEVVVAAFDDEIIAWHEQRKADERAMTDGTKMKQHARQIRLRWDEAAYAGNQTAEALIILVDWIEQNFEKMKTEAERWVATDTLREQAASPRAGIWDLDKDLPHEWTQRVKRQMVNLGATFSQKEAYNPNYLKGSPNPEISSDEYAASRGIDSDAEINDVPELKEEIYKRLDKIVMKKKIKSHLEEKFRLRKDEQREKVKSELQKKLRLQKEKQKQDVRQLIKSKLTELDTGYTQRTYKITMRIAMAKEHGGKRDETENEIRGVLGVGTVKILPGTTRQDGSNYYADVLVKFSLLGKHSVTQYIRSQLLPSMRSIEGLSVLRMDRYEEVNPQSPIAETTSTRFAYSSDAPDRSSVRPTPTPTIDQIAQDWMTTGEDRMGINVSNLAAQVRQETMIPVEELMRYLGTNYYSATMTEFEDAKEKLINYGPKEPVMIAVGRNGRVKIISGDDIVMAAKDIGLEELPVVFSLQLQV